MVNDLTRYRSLGIPAARVVSLLKELSDEERRAVADGRLTPQAALAIAKERRGDCVYQNE